MIYLAGLGIAFLSIVASILHLHQSIFSYFDLVAFFVVLGGTGAVAVITLPWDCKAEIKDSLKKLAFSRASDQQALLTETFQVIESIGNGRLHIEITTPGLPGEVLKHGCELIRLGFDSDKIELILSEKIKHAVQRSYKVANAFRSLAKYPPAFGLVGTVLGLVSLMRALADSQGAQETGLRMAVALVATLYGLLLSNLVINPAGEQVSRLASEVKKDSGIALQGILLASERTSLLESQELLNCFVSPEFKVNFLSFGGESAAQAAASDGVKEGAAA
jgi:chemotaxis protein MotA